MPYCIQFLFEIFAMNMGGQKWIPLISLTQIRNLLIDVIQTEIFSRFKIRKCAVDLNARISTLKKYITTLALYIILRSAKWNIFTFSYQDIGAPYYFIVSMIPCLVTSLFFSFFVNLTWTWMKLYKPRYAWRTQSIN